MTTKKYVLTAAFCAVASVHCGSLQDTSQSHDGTSDSPSIEEGAQSQAGSPAKQESPGGEEQSYCAYLASLDGEIFEPFCKEEQQSGAGWGERCWVDSDDADMICEVDDGSYGGPFTDEELAELEKQKNEEYDEGIPCGDDGCPTRDWREELLAVAAARPGEWLLLYAMPENSDSFSCKISPDDFAKVQEENKRVMAWPLCELEKLGAKDILTFLLTPSVAFRLRSEAAIEILSWPDGYEVWPDRTSPSGVINY